MSFYGSRIQLSQKLELRGGKKIRPIEILLFFANLLTFFALTVSLPRAMFWMRYSAPVWLLIAVLQVLLEGLRWQMLPAYAVSGLFFLVWLLQNIASWLGITGPIDGRRAYSIINAYSLAFFDRYLKGRSVVPIEKLARQFPEVLFQTRRP